MDCRIGLLPLYVVNTIIDMNDDLDIATFSLTREQVGEAGLDPFNVSLRWPTDVPIERDSLLQLIGFPQSLREIDHGGGNVICKAWSAHTIIHDCNDREIITIYDPDESAGTPSLPPLGFNLSGCSGGPAIVHDIVNQRWSPVGLILGGPKHQGEGIASTFDMIRIRRIECVGEDGRIKAERDGWLPQNTIGR